MAFGLRVLKIFIEILELSNIVDIVAFGKVYVGVSIDSCQISDVPAESELSSYIFVLLEVIDVLPFQQIDVINVLLLAHKFKVVYVGSGVLVLSPPVLIHQAALKVVVPYRHAYLSFNPVFLLVV